MVIGTQVVSAKTFWEIASLPENQERRLELDDGEIVEMPGSRMVNGVSATNIIIHVGVFVKQNNLGILTGPDTGYQLDELRVRLPDVAFVRADRVPDPLPSLFEGPPDLAVEVVSPQEDVFKKVIEYLRAGTPIVWTVYPDDYIVYVHTLDGDNIVSVPHRDALDGGTVLPGFRLPLSDIFP